MKNKACNLNGKRNKNKDKAIKHFKAVECIICFNLELSRRLLTFIQSDQLILIFLSKFTDQIIKFCCYISGLNLGKYQLPYNCNTL